MTFRILAVLALLLSFMAPAHACQFIAKSFDEALEAADPAFIGSVKTVENGLATFFAEKGLKGIKDGEQYDVESGREKSSCGLAFQPGQRWLFLGNSLPSGSLLLQDEEGRISPENLALVKQKIGDIPAEGSEVHAGTIERSCAPWDGAAFTIKLDNGVSASVYTSLGELDAKDKNTVAAYTADGKSQRGSASITQCPKPREGQTENLPCKSMNGTVSIGFVTADDVTGQIRTEEGEYHSLYVFHVKRLKIAPLCG